MSDVPVSKAGPALSTSVAEVRGVFPSDEAMQKAIGELTLAGFDRAALSLPTGLADTPNAGAANPTTDVDIRQTRTMGTSMAGTIGALAAAGATIATGGVAAVAVAAAAAVGTGAALTVNAVGNTADAVQASERDDAAKAGRLVLAVTAIDQAWQAKAEDILRAAGASEVGTVMRTSEVSGVDSSSWTG